MCPERFVTYVSGRAWVDRPPGYWSEFPVRSSQWHQHSLYEVIVVEGCPTRPTGARQLRKKDVCALRLDTHKQAIPHLGKWVLWLCLSGAAGLVSNGHFSAERLATPRGLVLEAKLVGWALQANVSGLGATGFWESGPIENACRNAFSIGFGLD